VLDGVTGVGGGAAAKHLRLAAISPPARRSDARLVHQARALAVALGLVVAHLVALVLALCALAPVLAHRRPHGRRTLPRTTGRVIPLFRQPRGASPRG
jgi:hypothetical protein